MKYLFRCLLPGKSPLLFSLWLGAFSHQVLCQDFQFGQYYVSPVLNNPAAAGFMSAGAHRLALMYRGQWDNAWSEEAYQGAAASYDSRRCLKNGFLAFGLHVQAEGAQLAGFRQIQSGISVAYHPQLARNLAASVGFYAGALHYALDPGALRFDAQWNGQHYDPAQSNEENFAHESRFHPDLGVGIMLYSTEAAGWSAGIALQHLNKPKYSFLGDENELGIGLSAHASYALPLSPSKQRQLVFRTLLRKQSLGQNSRQWQIMPGAMFKLVFSSDLDNNLTGGLYLRLSGHEHGQAFTADALVPTVHFNKGGWSFGLSYDANVSSLTTTPAGGVELTMARRFGDESRCIKCPGM